MKNNFPKLSLTVSFIVFCIFLFAFFYLQKEMNKNVQESKLKEVKFQTEALRRDEIRTLNNSINVIQKERTQLETHFAQSSNIVPFLDIIEGLATKIGVKAEVTSVDPLGDHAGLSVGMKASGSFSGVYKFITLLENSPYELEFVSMNIQKGSEVDAKGNIFVMWNAVFGLKLLSFIE
jgi:hypothetical protein